MGRAGEEGTEFLISSCLHYSWEPGRATQRGDPAGGWRQREGKVSCTVYPPGAEGAVPWLEKGAGDPPEVAFALLMDNQKKQQIDVCGVSSLYPDPE